MVSDSVAVCAVGVVESVAFAVNVNEPDAVGVPESVPVDAARLMPAGKAPDLLLQLNGVVPPLAAKVVEYAVPTCPEGTEPVVIVTGETAAATVMVSDSVAVCAVGVVESVTFTVNVNEPDTVGVPESVPVDAARLMPAGKAPELMLQLNGVVPPLAAKVVEYAVPTCPEGTEPVVIVTGETAAATVMVSDSVAVCAVGVVESVAFAVNVNEPDTVGVPESVPVDAARLMPAGKAPELMLQLNGVVPPLAAKVVEYAVPTCPEGTEPVVIVTGETAAATVMVSDSVAVCAVGVVESVTFTVNVNEPDTVGVPESVPVDAARLMPAGKAPELMLQLNGVVPPLAAKVVEYAV